MAAARRWAPTASVLTEDRVQRAGTHREVAKRALSLALQRKENRRDGYAKNNKERRIRRKGLAGAENAKTMQLAEIARISLILSIIL